MDEISSTLLIPIKNAFVVLRQRGIINIKRLAENLLWQLKLVININPPDIFHQYEYVLPNKNFAMLTIDVRKNNIRSRFGMQSKSNKSRRSQSSQNIITGKNTYFKL